MTALLLLATLNTSPVTTAQTNERHPKEPILRIETGMHTATIRQIAVDDANRFLVTVSLDKTLRVWELSSGRLLRTIRVPIGPELEGMLNAVAISPDGSKIAAAGHTTNKKGWVIYIFDRESGRLIHSLGNWQSSILNLLYSPDGKYLAATFSRNGLRIFSALSLKLLSEDSSYGESQVYAADFDHAGRLVTAGSDGVVRLYEIAADGSLQLKLKRRSSDRSDAGAYSASFSPDGSAIAVGFADLPSTVVVLSGKDLSPLYKPSTKDVTRGFFCCVAWSTDGSTLYAGGDYGGFLNRRIRYWTDKGRGPWREVEASTGAILHITPLLSGGAAFGTDEPAFGVLNSRGERTLYVGPHIVDPSGPLPLLVSSDGAKIQFQYDQRGKTSAQFSVSQRALEMVSDKTSKIDLYPPLTDSLNVTDWRDSETPKLNAKPLKLVKTDASRSLAIAPDAESFLLGTEFSLYAFDTNGVKRWENSSPSVAWAANISGDGRVAVAAYGDGTIRWYRMTDGKELLVFFPHADRKRWVLWTPSGYYDASPGAEELIGWHVNNGDDQAADFFPVGQFRATYYRPDVVSKILTTGDEQLALKQANQEAGRDQQPASIALLLPPVVELISPQDGSEVSATDITVQLRVRTPSGEPVTGYKVLVDGRPTLSRQLNRDENPNQAGETRQLRVTVPERDSEIAVIAENRFTSSVPATLRLKWRAPIAARPAPFVIKPKLYIFAVGVSRYANPKYNLKLAHKDARDFVNAMLAQKDLLYRDVEVKLLTNEEATKDEILDGLDWIRKETTSNDMAMVFFAGHGVNDQNNYYYFCPHNVDPDRLLRTGVTFSDIKNTVS
ncbi:MAG TPA: caspase family protein, partial [Pyrinomonadaceae bacterium]|nr:caspase family protein [Pyrinomonadaceae bacterium]